MNPIDRLLSLLAPHTCVMCRRENSAICAECLEQCNTLPSICYACGKATRAYRPCADDIGKLHPQHIWMYAPYNDDVKKILHAYKFAEKRAAAKPIADVMESSLPYFAEPPILTFVPTTSQHRRSRGFDHAELLAKEVAKLRGWHNARLLNRTSQLRQLGATRQMRKQQLKGAFNYTNLPIIKNKHIILIDDVVTTGATIEECTAVLKKAGAKQVDALVFARTMEK